jgi:hypothetical protein
MTEGYEALRAQATGAAAGPPRGLALCMRAGLPAWMAAWHALVGAARPAGAARAARRVGAGAAGRLGADLAALAVLLAEMAVAGQRRTRP